MIPADIVSGVATAPWFVAPWAPYALLDTNLCLVEVNPAFERATHQDRERILGRHAFEAFPDNPHDPDSDGVATVSRSMEQLLRTGTRQWLGFQRYDVPHPHRDGSFLPRIWMAVNAPIRKDGRVVGILSHCQDVTSRAGVPTAPPIPHFDGVAAQARVDALVQQFPHLDPQAALGVLTDSQRIVTHALDAVDHDRAADLARLRLEIHTRRPARPLP